jgi:hypothetical protein
MRSCRWLIFIAINYESDDMMHWTRICPARPRVQAKGETTMQEIEKCSTRRSLASLLTMAASAWAQTPQGEIKGEAALVHTAASAQDVIAGAQVALPASVTGGAPYLGPLRGAPFKEATPARAGGGVHARFIRDWRSRPLANGSSGWPAWALPAWRPTRLPCPTDHLQVARGQGHL